MIYSLLVQCSPSSHSIVSAALKFTRALIDSEHRVHRIFFYGDAVQLASHNTAQPQDQQDLFKEWRELIEKHELDAVVCIAAALKRGIINQEEAQRYQLTEIAGDPYDLSGLGQLIDACAHSDRLITFS